MSNHSARIVDLLVGVWLIVSAFLWPHAGEQFDNACTVGALTAAISAAAFVRPPARYVNSVLAVWLLVSTWVLPLINESTARNNIAVSILLFIFSSSAVSSVDRPLAMLRNQRSGPG